jgi:hypothetical protein
MRAAASLAALVATGLLTAGATPAAGAPGPPLIPSARLQGQFKMAGRVTRAVNVPGEHVGQQVLRIWTFSSLCATGPCPTVELLRTRANGTDTTLLRLESPGYYAGFGVFYAALRCGTRTYPRGEAVPFAVTVRVTASAVVGGVMSATRVTATYTNRDRTNLTPCVAAPAADAATYQGTLVSTPAP